VLVQQAWQAHFAEQFELVFLCRQLERSGPPHRIVLPRNHDGTEAWQR